MAPSTRVLIVGLNPSNKTTLRGKTSSTFKRLEKWMDYCGVKYFSFVNTFDYEKDTPSLADVDFNRLCTLTHGYDKIIALGWFVSRALNKIDVDHLAMPHPSPRNRKFNDPLYERQILSDCKRYVRCKS
jgi:uracil-DNA glycosylase